MDIAAAKKQFFKQFKFKGPKKNLKRTKNKQNKHRLVTFMVKIH